MNWNEFLKPTIGKIVLGLVSLALGYFLFSFPGGEMSQYGLPLPFHISRYGPNLPTESSINYLALVIDLIFWYLLASLIFLAYGKFKKKK